MIKFYLVFSILGSLTFNSSYGQTQKIVHSGGYTVDNNVKEKLKTKISSYEGVSFGSMDFKFYENDSLIIDSYAKGKSIESITMTTLDGDTANIVGFVGISAAFGFKISLFRDTCLVSYFESTDYIDTIKNTDTALYDAVCLVAKIINCH